MATIKNCPVCANDLIVTDYPAEGTYFDLECSRCGRFKITYPFFEEAKQLTDERRLALSCALRRRNDSGGFSGMLRSGEEELQAIIKSAGVPKTPFEQLDALLMRIADFSEHYGDRVRPREQNSWASSLGLRSTNQLVALVEAAKREGLVEANLSRDGIISITLLHPGHTRVRELNRPAVSNQCFVAMGSTTGNSPAYINGIHPALVESGWTPKRPEEEHFPDKIDDFILREIRRSGLMVADVTDDRPNVFFEAGLAMGLGLHVVWTVQEARKDNLHFDTRQYPHIVWTDAANLRAQLSARLGALGLTR